MTQRLLNSLVALLCATTLFSCGPKEKDKTNVEPEKPSNTFLLLGTWDVVFLADDDNENGQLDEEEKILPEPDENLSVYFRSDGTGETINTFEEIPGSPQEERGKFQWEFMNNETQLRIIDEYIDSVGSQVTTHYDTTVVNILDLSDVSTTWEVYDAYYNGADSTVYKSWIVLEKRK